MDVPDQELTEWVFGLEGPALILSLLMNAGTVWALIHIYKAKCLADERLITFIQDKLDEAKVEVTDQLKVLNQVSGRLGALHNQNTQTKQVVDECSSDVKNVQGSLQRVIDKLT